MVFIWLIDVLVFICWFTSVCLFIMFECWFGLVLIVSLALSLFAVCCCITCGWIRLLVCLDSIVLCMGLVLGLMLLVGLVIYDCLVVLFCLFVCLLYCFTYLDYLFIILVLGWDLDVWTWCFNCCYWYLLF